MLLEPPLCLLLHFLLFLTGRFLQRLFPPSVPIVRFGAEEETVKDQVVSTPADVIDAVYVLPGSSGSFGIRTTAFRPARMLLARSCSERTELVYVEPSNTQCRNGSSPCLKEWPSIAGGLSIWTIKGNPAGEL